MSFLKLSFFKLIILKCLSGTKLFFGKNSDSWF